MDIIKQEGNYLPSKLNELAEFVLVGRDKLNMVRAGIKALDKLDVAEEVRKQKREEAQMLAEALLDAEVRIGEILLEMPKAQGNHWEEKRKSKISTGANFTTKPKLEAAKELGFDQFQVSRFQTLAENKDLVEQVKQEARDEDDLPTRSAVLKAAKERKKEAERIESVSEKHEIQLPKVCSYDSNMYYESSEMSEVRYGDKMFSLAGEKYNTVNTLSRFFHKETGIEFTLREYADVQTFPGSYKFVGNYATIKKQIGNAVAPHMGKYITSLVAGKTVGDLFAGCGGFSCGAHENGFTTKWAVEWDEYAAKSFKLNFPETRVYQTNIQVLNPAEFEQVDVIIGGPPCQGFSSANHENKKVRPEDRFSDDPRNSLYKEFLRFVGQLKPMHFIMENVPEIQDVEHEIVSDFIDIGYDVYTQLVEGNEIGMKQNRKRFFFIGTKTI